MSAVQAGARVKPRCPACGSIRWVSVSLNEGLTRLAQCIPCGAYHHGVIGPGWQSPRFHDPEAVHPDYRKHWNEDWAVRFQPRMDEYGRWAVQDTAQPQFYLFIQRYSNEDSAQSFCDVLNAVEAGQWQKMRRLELLHQKIVRYAPMIERSRS